MKFWSVIFSLIGTLCLAANEPPAGTKILYPADQAVMVYVPAGEFTMGLDPAEADQVARDLGFKQATDLWAWDCYPKHKVTLVGYFIDLEQVSIGRYRRFRPVPGDPQMPIGSVSWADAKAYAVWAGKALPTDAQWEKAARGTDGRLYPWGNEAPTADRGHFSGSAPERVGSYPKGASPYGCLDMLGNQYQWTCDWLEPYPGNPQADKMKSYTEGKNVSLRGGSWYHGMIGIYAAKRFGLSPTETYHHIGFRTVWVPPAGYFDSKQFQQDRAKVPADSPPAPPR